MKIVILGCGPAGLLSAYACEMSGHHKVSIVSYKVKSKIPGAVFLHEPISPLTAPDPEAMVRFIKHGTKAGYAKKVYGSVNAECSWDSFPEGYMPAWSMFALYDKLWSHYSKRIVNRTVDHRYIGRLMRDFDLIISTIPAQALCHNRQHSFESQSIFIMNKAVAWQDNVIVYNGSLGDSWYRTSRIFKHESTEATVPFEEELTNRSGVTVSKGFKPLRTDCTCHPQIARIGRYGRWKKGILVHHAYEQTVKVLEALK